ncbi:MAG: hypothetical protein HC942_07015 [Microcoleus sp. SU_5_6]|nr:hypothetical protein [Microcoleus sp. SU_5_6]NJL66527.1 hypothetical protein [Microcoleus sp. SM1_3_4]
MKYQQESLKIALEIGNRYGEATSLGKLGDAYYGLENLLIDLA